MNLSLEPATYRRKLSFGMTKLLLLPGKVSLVHDVSINIRSVVSLAQTEPRWMTNCPVSATQCRFTHYSLWWICLAFVIQHQDYFNSLVAIRPLQLIWIAAACLANGSGPSDIQVMVKRCTPAHWLCSAKQLATSLLQGGPSYPPCCPGPTMVERAPH